MPDQPPAPKLATKQSIKKPSKGVSTRDAIDAVQVELEAFIGEARVSLSDLDRLEIGKQLQLNRQLNELVELKLNGTTIATGELVAIDDHFGVRITEVG